MDHYPLFLVMALATVLSPGPGVLLTVTNALRHGLLGALGGILGIAMGALVVAAVSATSVGVVLSTSITAFNVMKFVGAAYLFYLGMRMIRSPAPGFHAPKSATSAGGLLRRYGEGLSLQLTNPKAIFFFISIFPQFIRLDSAYAPQFALLVLTYSGLVVLIHTGYAVTADRLHGWLTSARGGRWINRLGGATFIFFAAVLASASR